MEVSRQCNVISNQGLFLFSLLLLFGGNVCVSFKKGESLYFIFKKTEMPAILTTFTIYSGDISGAMLK